MSARAVIFGCAGPALLARERDFFAEVRPWGFILFKRNCETPDQVRRLVDGLRAAVDCADAPVLIDQEGGPVQRLAAPRWRRIPAAAAFGELAAVDPLAAEEACRLNARLIAAELTELGIDVDCLPCLDVRQADGHGVIGDRAFGCEPGLVARLGRAVADGLLAGGALPVIKHIPGHGRARVDSHDRLPRVDAAREELEAVDFAPFQALADLPMAMTAHVLYAALDDERPATTSPTVIAECIRGRIGFDGLLMSDDISMRALSGDVATRCRAALRAGCDVVLHCNGDFEIMQAVSGAVGPLRDAALARAERVSAWRRPAVPFDAAEAAAHLDALLAPVRADGGA